MRILLTVLSLALFLKTFSQTRMCEENTVMYSICYELDTNGTFKYNYSHCTGSVLGTGTYKKTKSSITFTYDSILSPQIHRYKGKLKSGEVEIFHKHLINDYPIEYAKINYNQHSYTTDSAGTIKLDYSGGPIVIYQDFDRDSVIINPDKDNSNTYEIRWHSPGDTFMKAGTTIKMKKKGPKYKFKEKVLGYNDKKGVYFPMWRTTYYVIKSE